MKRMLMIVVLLMSIAGADTLYFKNGDVLKNCREVKRTETYLTVEYVQSGVLIKNHFNFSSIDRLEPGKFDAGENSITKSAFQIYQKSEKELSKPELKLNYKMLPVSVIAFTLSFREFNTIEKYKITGKLKKECQNYGTIYLITGIANMVMAFETVEFTPTGSGVNLSYKF